jgi:hypothetical protein
MAFCGERFACDRNVVRTLGVRRRRAGYNAAASCAASSSSFFST